MYLRPFRLGVCLVLCVGGLLGLYRLQAETRKARHQETTHLPPASQSQRQPRLDPKTEPLFADDLHRDFYQTIIRNNLFAPLGTDLHQKPAPGAILTLVGTFVSEDPTHSTAVIKNETTRQQARFVIGEIFDDFQVVEIQPKQVTLDHNGQSVVLRLPSTVLLN